MIYTETHEVLSQGQYSMAWQSPIAASMSRCTTYSVYGGESSTIEFLCTVQLDLYIQLEHWWLHICTHRLLVSWQEMTTYRSRLFVWMWFVVLKYRQISRWIHYGYVSSKKIKSDLESNFSFSHAPFGINAITHVNGNFGLYMRGCSFSLTHFVQSAFFQDA